MKRRILAAVAAVLCIQSLSTAQPRDWVDLFAAEDPASHPSEYVSTLVGTLTDQSLSTGNNYPAIAVPWGMNFWTPMTSDSIDERWIYTYGAHKITGFKQVHQPSPWIGDYGAFCVMPFKDGAAFPSWFSHESEIARPYYYRVYLADHDLTVEIAPTERAAIFRITYPESESSGLAVDAAKGGKVFSDGLRIKGWTRQNTGGVSEGFKNYFIIESDTPFTADKAGSEDESKASILFPTSRRQQVIFRMASSFISGEQALRNLNEVSGKTFDEVKKEAQSVWDEMLGRIKVEGGTVDQYRTFYSCLYRSLLFPRRFYEISPDGTPYHYSPFNGKVEPGYMYTDNGFWDTFRAQFPLLNLVYPDVNKEIQSALANIARENDFLPEWMSPGHRNCMIGQNSASIITDAALQGVNTNKEDLEKLYEALVYATCHVHPTEKASGRVGYEYYNKYGYIPFDSGISENVARTLEYAYDDWCLAQLSSFLGRPKEEQEKWLSRSQNWRNVFDPEVRLMRGRNADGTFQSPFNPYRWGDAYTEGNAWHYTWSVFHDVPGLVEAMGGKKSFEQMLDSVLIVPPIYDYSYYGQRFHELTEMTVADMGNYAHGNQPSQHMLYLYDWTDAPWKGQLWLRDVMNRLYKATPDGYCGDEDCGQTSAWYVFSAMGFYPVCPGSGEYAVGSPLFQKVTITFPDGKKLEIKAPGNSAATPLVEEVRLNGKKVSSRFLDIPSLKKGGALLFKMKSYSE